MMIEAFGCQGVVEKDFEGKWNYHLMDILLFDDIVLYLYMPNSGAYLSYIAVLFTERMRSKIQTTWNICW